MNIPQWFPAEWVKFLPQKPAKYTKILALVTIGFFALVGLGLSVRALEESAAAFFLIWLYYIFLGLIAAIILIYAFDIFARIARKGTKEKIAAQYAQQGFCLDMAESVKAIMPSPSERDLVLRSFFLVMSEHYKEAELQMSRINQPALSMREYSMLMTSKIRLSMMTGDMEKAAKLIEQNQVKMDLAYENKPEYFDDYRAYADDTFEYFMLSAVYYDLIQQPDTAAAYRKKAEFQASNRSTAEMDFYKELLELNRLYILGKTQEAHILENNMRGMVANIGAPVSQGMKNDMLRAAEQAKVFAAARMSIDTNLLQQRVLPTQGGSAIPSDFAAM